MTEEKEFTETFELPEPGFKSEMGILQDGLLLCTNGMVLWKGINKQTYDATFTERLIDMKEDFVMNIKKRKFKRAFRNLRNYLKLLSRIIIIEDYSSKEKWFDFFIDEQIHHIDNI